MLYFMRALLVLFASVSGYIVLYQLVGKHNIAVAGFISGLIIAICAVFFEERVKRTPLRIVAGGAFGLIIGLIVATTCLPFRL